MNCEASSLELIRTFTLLHTCATAVIVVTYGRMYWSNPL